jgi:hypothetical protein
MLRVAGSALLHRGGRGKPRLVFGAEIANLSRGIRIDLP